MTDDAPEPDPDAVVEVEITDQLDLHHFLPCSIASRPWSAIGLAATTQAAGARPW